MFMKVTVTKLKCDQTAVILTKLDLIPCLCSYARAAVSRLQDVFLQEADLISEQTLHNLSRWHQVRC